MVTDDPQPVYFISDAEALQFVSTDKAFDKDVSCVSLESRYRLWIRALITHLCCQFTLNLFGDHIIRASGSDWKRHRAIANPAFNEVRYH